MGAAVPVVAAVAVAVLALQATALALEVKALYDYTQDGDEEALFKDVALGFLFLGAGKVLEKGFRMWKAGKNVDDAVEVTEEIAKPYTKSRPSYGKNQVDEVFENAKQADGNVYDPNTGELIPWNKTKPRNGQWDMGHNPGKEYRKYHKDYMDGKITKEEFLKIHRNPSHYQPELPGPNRSHKYEQK